MEPLVSALLGGVLIGASASLLLWLDGRIAGVSGIVNGLLPATRDDTAWRVAFLAGLMGAGALTMHVLDQDAGSPARWPVVVAAGLLVGFGTRLGNGCTSGHGVCGLARLSVRSLVAVLCFMASAIVTVFVTRHVFGGGP
jgi:uncharacterized protein